MREYSDNLKLKGKSVGFVPTMGYLHQGHISLVQTAQKKCDEVIVSIFVNPTQFAPNEDFTKYPRDEENDLRQLEENNVSAVFFPDVNEIYSEDFQTYVNVEEITKTQEGEFRPVHFKGVTTIVSILFNCVNPDVAVFGQKDAQQAAVIVRMVKDLKFPVKIIIAPIVRENDGLAMSSRNVYLSDSERKDALVLNSSLNLAEKLIQEGEVSTGKIIDEMKMFYKNIQSSSLQYIRIVESESFTEIEKLETNKSYYILIACKIGNTRLIDNRFIKV